MDKNEYRTQSLCLAAAIQLVSKSKLKAIEKSPQDFKATFVFDYATDIQNIVEQFFQKQLQHDLFSYFESLRYIKSRLYESK